MAAVDQPTMLSFCAAALEQALLRFGRAENTFDTDQRLRFHRLLKALDHQASDGRRRDFEGRTRPIQGQDHRRRTGCGRSTSRIARSRASGLALSLDRAARRCLALHVSWMSFCATIDGVRRCNSHTRSWRWWRAGHGSDDRGSTATALVGQRLVVCRERSRDWLDNAERRACPRRRIPISRPSKRLDS